MTRRTEKLSGQVPEELAGQRLDQALARRFSQYSRSRRQHWLKQGCVLVDGKQQRPRDKVYGGEQIEINAVLEAEGEWQPQAIALDIVYEDEALIVLNKPAGLVVHPAAGNPEGTMLNALLHHDPDLATIPRAGIVHRLDKDTTGLLVVARTLEAQKRLVEQLQARRFLREYQAVVNGIMTAGGSVEAPIGRHPVQRKRMAVVNGGKPALTHYRLEQRFRAHTWLRVKLETGRTHQIRVHMAHLHHPLVGDPLYGGRLRLPRGCDDTLRETLQHFKRQALHASQLGLCHPHTGEMLHWQQPLPADMTALIEQLQRDLAEHPENER